MAVTRGRRTEIISGMVTPQVKADVRAVAGHLKMAQFVSDALEQKLRHCTPPTDWYLAGPMSGIEDSNYPAFTEAASRLRALGFPIVSPHEISPMPDATASDRLYCLRVDVATLAWCKGIILLPGWEQSTGARLELHVAQALDMPVKRWTGLEVVDFEADACGKNNC